MGVATIQAKAMQTFMKTLLSELRRTVSAEDVNTKVRRDSAQTKAKGDAIVDKAVYAASEGLYANFQQLANEFMISQSVFGGTGKKDGSDYARKRQYLKSFCDIDQYGTRGETIRVTDAVGKRILVTDNTGKWSSFTASQKSVSGASSMMPSKNSLSYLYDNNIVSSGSFVGSLSATVQSQTNRMMVAGAH